MNVNKKTLELFNAVIFSPWERPYFLDKYGVLVDSTASNSLEDIEEYLKKKALDGEQLNKTFHKSWDKVLTSSRYELYIHQMLHYITTYGTGHSSTFVYIPDENLDVPQIKTTLKIIRGLSEGELISKSLDMLTSGIALKGETIDLLFEVLDGLGYRFTGKEGIKNKEALIKLADVYGIYPENPSEFLRFLIFKSTGNTLVIKNKETIEAIKNSNFNPSMHLNKFGLKEISTIFNRYKPLFLAFKSKCPSVINRISKLSKVHHKAMKEDLLNLVTSKYIEYEDLYKRLKIATFFQTARALQALHSRSRGQNVFTYKIRNGKSFTKENKRLHGPILTNLSNIKEFLIKKYNFEGKKFYIPNYIEYAIPTSEKMFVGNIPMGTKIYGNDLAVGIYWENEWGASDLDLSAISTEKIGWNSNYNNGEIAYSGDLTDAPNGAVEYMKINNIKDNYLILNNVFSGDMNSGYKIIVGKGDNISKEYMMNPNNLIFETKTETTQKFTITGIVLPDPQCFVVLGMGAGNMNIASSTELSNLQRKSLVQQYKNMFSLNRLITLCGGEIVDTIDKDTIDLSPNVLEKDTLINLFK